MAQVLNANGKRDSGDSSFVRGSNPFGTLGNPKRGNALRFRRCRCSEAWRAIDTQEIGSPREGNVTVK